MLNWQMRSMPSAVVTCSRTLTAQRSGTDSTAPVGSRARYIEAPKAIADVADDALFAELDPLLATA